MGASSGAGVVGKANGVELWRGVGMLGVCIAGVVIEGVAILKPDILLIFKLLYISSLFDWLLYVKKWKNI